jgi:hypothetical protein
MRRWLPWAALALTVAVGTSVAATAGAAASGPSDSETDPVAFARAFTAAWNIHDLEAIHALFVTDAVITFDYGPAGIDDGPAEYRGAAEPFSLRSGVAALAATGVRVDPSGLRVAPVDFGGAPAMLARWSYQRTTLLAALPPEVGEDAVVLRAGCILAYTRTPDPTSRRAREKALDGALSAMATQTARPTVAPPGAALRASEPTDASWPLRLAGLGAAAALAARWRGCRTRRG